METDPMRRLLITLALTCIATAPCVCDAQSRIELTRIDACNKGADTVFSFTAVGVAGHESSTLGWMPIPPHGCNNVFAEKVPGVDPAYVGFAVRGPDGRLTSITATVPEYGTDAKGARTFSGDAKDFCLVPYTDSLSFFTSKRDDDASHCNDWINTKITDPERRHYAAFTSSLYFRPKLDCGVLSCGPGSYYLDVTHAPGSRTVSLVRGLSPAQQGLQLIGKFLQALDDAKRQSDIQQQVALQNRFARYKPGSAASWAEQWANAPHMSPADYNPEQVGSTVVVSGTVARYVVDASGSPQWITIYFKESPNGAFVVCSPYPDMFQEVVGMNLNALIGKRLEAVGPIEQAICTGRGKTAGSIRVLESGMFHIK
jgi:hypothetical protein